MNQRTVNPFTLPPLHQPQVLIDLINFTEQKSQNVFTQSKMYEKIDQMTRENGFTSFDQQMAIDFFNQIKVKGKPLTLEQLSLIFQEAELILRKNYEQLVIQEEALKDSSQLLQRIDQYLTIQEEGENYIIIEEVKLKIKDQLDIDPILQVKFGLESFELESTEKGKDGWFKWKINLKLTIETFKNDLQILAFTSDRQFIGAVELNIESLPYLDLSYAQLNLQDNQGWTRNILQVCCQLILKQKEHASQLSKEKQLNNKEQMKHLATEMENLEIQLREIQKPFKIQHSNLKSSNLIKVSRANYQQQEWSPKLQQEPSIYDYLSRTDLFSMANLVEIITFSSFRYWASQFPSKGVTFQMAPFCYCLHFLLQVKGQNSSNLRSWQRWQLALFLTSYG